MKKLFILIFPLLFMGCSLFKSSKDIKLIPYLQKDKYGYFDLEGKIVINPQFAAATAFRDGLALVKTTGDEGKWGFIDQEGKFVINAIYKDATVFQDGLAWVISENCAPVAIDKSGDIQFTLKDAEEVRMYCEGLAAFSKSDGTDTQWGFVDKSGKQVITPQFVSVGNFHDGKCVVKNKDGKWGYIDTAGKIVINYQFDNVAQFIDGKAVVYSDDKAGVIDENGKYIVNPQFKYAFADNDMFLVYQDDKAGWCDADGKFIINPQFDEANLFGDSKLGCIKSSDKYGYIDKKGKILINPQFDEASRFIGDIAIVKSGDKYGLIDEDGKYKVNPQFDEIGYDVFAYLYDYSTKESVKTDYFDVNAVLKVININNPENLSFDDTFQTILAKTNTTINDFNAFNNTNVIFSEKAINKDVDYGFAVDGTLKEMDVNTFQYRVSTNKPERFIYGFTLKGKASDKAETLQKAFEKKLNGYTLIKKGYVEGNYTSVYKGSNNVIITMNNGPSNPVFVICKKDFDYNYYIGRIVDKKESIEAAAAVADTTAVEAAPAEAPAADTTAVAE